MNEDNLTIVFFGDSLTQRTGITLSNDPAHRFSLDYAGSYVDILIKKLIVHYPELKFKYFNRGFGGNTAVDLLSQVEDILSKNPDWVVLFIGQNDAKRYSPSEYRQNLINLIKIFKENKIKVLQLSTTPGTDEERNRILDAYDSIIKNVCKDYDNHYVELKEFFKKIKRRNESSNIPINVYNAGCHFSELGNILIADLVFDVMAKIL